MDHAIPDFLARLAAALDASVRTRSDLHSTRALDSCNGPEVTRAAGKAGEGAVVTEA